MFGSRPVSLTSCEDCMGWDLGIVGVRNGIRNLVPSLFIVETLNQDFAWAKLV
jgi:hypothetical protein